MVRLCFFLPRVAAICLPTLATIWLPAQTHGTINILLANKNGIVLVTDSRATASDNRHFDNAAKLFQIDDNTICSIADFGTDPGPYKELKLEVTGVVRDFRYNLAQSPEPLSFEKKLQILAFEIFDQFQRLKDEYNFSDKVLKSKLSSQVLMAGYDLDGSAKIAKLEIIVNGDKTFGASYSPHIEQVTNTLLFLTAGLDNSVQARLKYPDQFPKETALQVYALAKKRDGAANMTLEELEELAEYLEKDSATTHEVIGGPIQKAVLHNGQTELTVPPHLAVGAKPNKFVFTGGVFVSNSVLPAVSSYTMVYMKYGCKNSGVKLDHSLFYSGTLDHCYFYFNGGDFYRDPKVVIVSGYLVLGPDVTADDYRVKRAQELLPELNPVPVPYKVLNLSEDIQKKLWSPPADN